jgi:4-hydroxy-tetrahydrodipicolinate synthase
MFSISPMNQTELRESLRNVAFTTATPFTDDLAAVDHDALRENLAAVESAGGELYVPNGNTGEYYSLTPEERIEVAETTAAAVDGCVIAGASGSIEQVIDYAQSYDDAGINGVMIMHPAHPYKHEVGLTSYYTEIADRSPIGIIIYKRGRDLPNDVLVDLAAHDNIAGIKYADADIKAFSRITRNCDEDVVWINGIAERFAPAFALEGAEGFTTGIGNFVPEETLALEAAIESERWEQAREIRDELEPYEALRDEAGANNSLDSAYNIPAVKTGLDVAGLNGGPVRPPLVDLDGADVERAHDYYQRISNLNTVVQKR